MFFGKIQSIKKQSEKRLSFLFLVIFSFVLVYFWGTASLVFAAETAVDTSIYSTNTVGFAVAPAAVCIDDQKCFVFYLDSGGGISMASTTDGGTTWTGGRNVDSVNTTDVISVGVWWEGWTPGTTTTRYIHIATTDSGVDDTYYTRYDITNNTFSTSVVATTQAAACTTTSGGGGDCFPTITMTSDGALYMATAEATDRWVVKCTTTCTNTANWAEIAGGFQGTNGDDYSILMPVPGTNNVLLTWWDISADAIYYNVYSATSSSWWQSTTVSVATAADDNTTYDAQLIGMSISSSTGQVALTFVDDANDYTTADHDIKFYIYASTTGWTAKTNPVTNSLWGITGAKVSYDAQSDVWYVIYGYRLTIGTNTTAKIYYKYSTDGGTSWSAEQGPINASADDINCLTTGVSSYERIVAAWNYTTAPKQDDLYFNTVSDIYPTLDIGGVLYGSDRETPVATSQNLKLVIATSTPSVHSTSSVTTTGDFDFSLSGLKGVASDRADSFVVYVDGNASLKATAVVKIATTSVVDLGLYKDHVSLGSAEAMLAASDLYAYDSTGDSDIQYIASSTLGRLTITDGQKLYVASSTTFHLDTNIYADSFEVATTATTYASSSLSLTGDFAQNGDFKVADASVAVWTVRTPAENTSWRSVVYGNGLFVAVSISATNRVMTSPDGITWTSRSAAGNNDTWYSVTFGNGLFVAVGGGSDRVMTSPDGINWTVRTAAQSNTWLSVTYGEGLFVAVSQDGTNRVMTSPDGITWSPRSAAGNDDWWWAVTYGNGLFVAVGYYSFGDRVMTSPDGITWTARTDVGTSNTWFGVAYGNGLFVAVGGGSDYVMTSPDGITWTAQIGTRSQSWQSLLYGGGLFVAAAYSGNGDRVMTSPDGITWTARSAAGDNDSWTAVTYGDGRLVAVSNGSQYVMTSAELPTISFTGTAAQTISGELTGGDSLPNVYFAGAGTKIFNANASTSAFTIATSSGTVVAPSSLSVSGNYSNNNVFTAPTQLFFSGTENQTASGSWDGVPDLMLSGGGTKYFNINASTTDLSIASGVTFSAPSQVTIAGDYSNSGESSYNATVWSGYAVLEGNYSWKSVVRGGGTYVAVGETGSYRAMYSSDGITWATTTAAGDNDAWSAVTYGNGRFVAVGYNGGSDHAMYSDDGINWTTATAAEDNDNWSAVTYGNGRFVAVSYSGDRVMYSSDGITWATTTAAGDDDNWFGITYGDGQFVAVGAGPGDRVMTSPDGITWTARTAAAANTWRGVTYGGGQYVAVSNTGTGNRVMTSPDGITWTSRTSTADNSWQSVAYGDGLFAAVAYSSTFGSPIMTSPDGITWTSRSTGSNSTWWSVIYGDGLFIAVSYACNSSQCVMTAPMGKVYFTGTSAQSISGSLTGASAFGDVLFTGAGVKTVSDSISARDFTVDAGATVVAPEDLIVLGDYQNNGTTTYSSIGEEWVARSTPTTQWWYSVAYGNSVFVATAGYFGDRVMYSYDGINWATTTAAGDDEFWKAVTFGNGRFVAVSRTGSGEDRVMYSSDGITWATTTTAAGDDDYWEAVTYGNGRFVAVSYSGDRVMYSSDGITWATTTAAGDDDNWQGVTYGNGRFVAVGSNGFDTSAMYSDDGITWTPVSIGTDSNGWKSVTFGNGLFVATGEGISDYVMTSPDGANWTMRTAAEEQAWGPVTYGDGLFVATAASGVGYLMTSSDGINWATSSALADAGSTNWQAITYGNGLFVAVGKNGTFQVMTSGAIALFEGASDQTVEGSLAGASAFNNVSVTNSGTTTFSANASTTGLIIGSNTTFVAPAELSIAGSYTNNGTFHASTSVILNGTITQYATGTMTGTSSFENLTITNTSGTGATQSVVFGAPVTTTGTFTMIASTSAAFLAGATSTFEDIDWRGTTDSPVWLRSTVEDEQWYLDIPGSQLDLAFVDVQDSNASSSAGGEVTAINSTDRGNNSNWTFLTMLGSTTIANHDDTQVNNAFSFQNVTNGSLFAFKLIPESGTATVTDLVVTISGAKNIDSSDFSSIRLYKDHDNDAAYDAADELVSTGSMTLSGQSGALTFTTDFLSTTTTNYLVVADWNAPENGSFLRLSLYQSGVTAIDEYSTHTIYGSVDSIQHNRNNKGGGGGVNAAIGDPAPEGDGDVFGGEEDGGEQIGDDPNYQWPTAHSGDWTNGGYAYDNSDGTYATTGTTNASTSYTSYGYSIPGTDQITGVEVKLEAKGNDPTPSISVQLSWDGGATWTSTKSTGLLISSDKVISLGGPSDTWGRAWSPGEFSNANFKVRIIAGTLIEGNVRVDALQVRVYHQATGGGAGGGGAI